MAIPRGHPLMESRFDVLWPERNDNQVIEFLRVLGVDNIEAIERVVERIISNRNE